MTPRRPGAGAAWASCRIADLHAWRAFVRYMATGADPINREKPKAIREELFQRSAG